jgi:predicted NodU family carbamoyl transferase
VIEAFRQQTGCPVVTSFNVRGEPIVCIRGRVSMLHETEIDLLVLDVRKVDQPPV